MFSTKLAFKPKTKPQKQESKKNSDEAVSNNKTDWYSDKYQSIIIQRNIIFVLASSLLFLSIFSLFIVKVITEKKSVEPFVVRIDKTSGIATSIEKTSKQKYISDEIIQKYFLYQYIRARESYDLSSYQYNYFMVVRLMSTPSVYNQFLSIVSSRNEKSPVNLYGRTSSVEVGIKSIQYLSEETVQFRLLKTVKQGNAVREREHLIVLVDFTVKDDIPLTFGDRLVNPLGFVITKYKTEKEIVDNVK